MGYKVVRHTDLAQVPIREASSIPQRLPRLQRVLNPLLRLLLAAQRFESFPLQIEDVLLADRRRVWKWLSLSVPFHGRHPQPREASHSAIRR